MPSGYTEILIREEISFKDFALRCSRAFGALIDMRNEPLSTPIIQEVVPSDYHSKALAAAQVGWDRLAALTPEGIFLEGGAYNLSLIEKHKTQVKERNVRIQKYEAMLEKVRAWEPPTPDHRGLKDFMILQINQSIEFDYPSDEPELLSPEKWHKSALDKAEWDVNYHGREYNKELERCRERTEWIQSLIKSLA